MSEIKDYFCLGDLHSSALVSKEESIDWLCLPHFVSPSIFAKKQTEQLLALIKDLSLEKCYNTNMYNWSTDTKKQKKNAEKYAAWRLEQMINYGLDGEKLNREEVCEMWDNIKDNLDPYKKRALEYLLWGKLYSLPNNLNFWNMSPKMSK